MAGEMGDDAGVGASEVRCIPFVDRRDDEHIAVEPDGPGRVDIGSRRSVQGRPEGGAAERLQRQVRTADRGAVDGVVNARLDPAFPQDVVLHVVQRQVDPPDRYQPPPPRPRQQARADVPDGAYGIGIKDHINGHGVVQIGPEGKLLGACQAQGAQTRQGRDIGRQGGAIGRGCLPACIVETHDPVARVSRPAGQQGIKG